MNFRPMNSNTCARHCGASRAAGFTLVEFMVAMAMFVVLGGAVLEMFAKQAPYFTRQQNLVGINIAMQNAVSQLQVDLVNAGTGYYPGTIISSWPIGVTIQNQLSTNPACNVPATYSYTATCFDTLNILTLNPSTPPAHPTDITGGGTASNCSLTTDSPTAPTAGNRTLYIQPNVIAGDTVAQELTATAAGYGQGDQLLLVTSSPGGSHGTIGPQGVSSAASSNGILVNSIVLTGPPAIGAKYVALPYYSAGLIQNDPLQISTQYSTNLGYYFCSQDWVMKLEPTVYSVDSSDPQDPKLTRKFGNNAADTIAEQIIGFKVGASTWNPNASADQLTYSFYSMNSPTATAPTPTGYTNDFEEVRSVRVSLIGRTNPNPDPTYTFRNTFDGGPYQVVDANVVINPRNITMNGH
jgi:type II secretory pathway pseudopilin PulG